MCMISPIVITSLCLDRMQYWKKNQNDDIQTQMDTITPKMITSSGWIVCSTGKEEERRYSIEQL